MTDQFWIFPFAAAAFIVAGLVMLWHRTGRLIWISGVAAMAIFVIWGVVRTDRAVAETCLAKGYSPAGGGLTSPYCVDATGRPVILPDQELASYMSGGGGMLD